MASKGIPPTVKNFIAVLISKLTQFDQKISMKERNPNIYRIGHFLEAAHKVEEDLKAVGLHGGETMTIEIADALKKILRKRFILRQDRTTFEKTDKFDLPPINTLVKQVDAYLTKGKNPSLIG